MKAVKAVFRGIRGLFITLSVGMMSGQSVLASSTTDKGYVLGVFPYLPPRQIEKIYAPIAQDFARLLNKPVTLESRRTYQEFKNSVAENKFDIVFIQPFDFVWAEEHFGYTPLATRHSMLSAIVVTLPESPLTSIRDLRSKTIASTDRSAAVSYLMRDTLEHMNINPEKDVVIEYHRSHFSCMQQVLMKRAEACITAKPALRFFENKMSRQLKTIGKSAEIAHALFAADSDINETEKKLLRQRILNWPKTDEGKRLLATGHMKPFRAVRSEDYDSVREIAGRHAKR